MAEESASPAEGEPLASGWTREIIHVDDVLQRLDAVTESPAPPERDIDLALRPIGSRPEMRDPGERWWVGRFFPNDCSQAAAHFPWRREGDPFVMRVRHLPGRRTLASAEMRLGERAAPILRAWRELWATCSSPDELDLRRRLGLASEEWERHLADRIAGHEALAGGFPREALDRAIRSPEVTPEADNRVRDPAYHILEDASVHLALMASGMPFVLDMPMAGALPWRFVRGPSGGLRRLTPESEEYIGAGQALSEAWSGAQPYWRSRAFRERAGREMAVADGLDALRVILVDMAAQGRRMAFLKSCRSKGGTWSVDLTGLAGSEDAMGRVARAMGASFLTLFCGAGERALLVQEHVPFLREHRFLVVGHRVVASTASVRSLSVLDAQPNRIVHPFVAALRVPAGEPGPYDRGESVAVPDRALAARMAWCARDLARALSREADTPDLYCIDVGEDRDGQVMPIELNGLSSSGLYALHWRRVADALHRRHRRRAAAEETGPRAESTVTLTVRPFVGEVATDEGSLVNEAANHFVRWAMTRPLAPVGFGYIEENRDEIVAFIQREFAPPTRKAMRRAIDFFDPVKHPAWIDRYVAWLGNIGIAQALTALGDIQRLCRADSIKAWAVHASAPGEPWRSVPRRVALMEPEPDDDVTGHDDDDGIVSRISFPPSLVDVAATLNRRVRYMEPCTDTLVLVRGAEVTVEVVRDHGTGRSLLADEAPFAGRVE